MRSFNFKRQVTINMEPNEKVMLHNSIDDQKMYFENPMSEKAKFKIQRKGKDGRYVQIHSFKIGDYKCSK